MENLWHRREIMKLLGLGGVAFASGLGACHPGAAGGPGRAQPAVDDFFFLQLSDTHWGYQGAANPLAEHTLRDTVRLINQSALRPAFVMFTGDLIQTSNDDAERRDRMRQFREIVAELRVPTLRFIPGEHDAAVDQGAAYQEHFGARYYTFEHGGVHFIALDNASDPTGGLGAVQLAWLRDDLHRVAPDTKVVVFAHRPLFPLFPSWSWNTPDGERAIALLAERTNVTVFYGHIHQEHHHQTGPVMHHAARSLVFPLPLAGSVPTRAPLPWRDGAQDHGLGYRTLHAERAGLALAEVPVLPG